MDKVDIRTIALSLLRSCYQEEIEHLKLRIIRDNQAPRFEALKESHPDIYKDFMEAREGPHEKLAAIRYSRVEVLRNIIENSNRFIIPED